MTCFYPVFVFNLLFFLHCFWFCISCPLYTDRTEDNRQKAYLNPKVNLHVTADKHQSDCHSQSFLPDLLFTEWNLWKIWLLPCNRSFVIELCCNGRSQCTSLPISIAYYFLALVPLWKVSKFQLRSDLFTCFKVLCIYLHSLLQFTDFYYIKCYSAVCWWKWACSSPGVPERTKLGPVCDLFRWDWCPLPSTFWPWGN